VQNSEKSPFAEIHAVLDKIFWKMAVPQIWESYFKECWAFTKQATMFAFKNPKELKLPARDEILVV